MDRLYSQCRFWCYEGNIRAQQLKRRSASARCLLLLTHSINVSLKKRSHKEWRDLIRAELKGKGKDRYCAATCPICLISFNVNNLSSDASARTLAVGKVASHINNAHADALTDWVKTGKK